MSERSEVKRDGAKAQKNSGRGDYQKGDAKWNQFLVDYIAVTNKVVHRYAK